MFWFFKMPVKKILVALCSIYGFCVFTLLHSFFDNIANFPDVVTLIKYNSVALLICS